MNYKPLFFTSIIIRMGFPKIAKLALGSIAALILAIIGAAWFVVRRVRRD